MRIILVGSPAERARLRAELRGAPIDIAGEFETLTDLRAAGISADAVLLANEEGPREVRNGPGGGGPPPLSEEEDWIEETLTPRELNVLELLAEGLPNKAIASRLDISDQTVKVHVASILGKLGASNRTDAVRRALRRGLISL
jgi:DNA-binding NarL/FixJ family response regulator